MRGLPAQGEADDEAGLMTYVDPLLFVSTVLTLLVAVVMTWVILRVLVF